MKTYLKYIFLHKIYRLTPNINNLISRLDRYMEQSKIDVGDRLLILGISGHEIFCNDKKHNHWEQAD